jgi:hypothetical protein
VDKTILSPRTRGACGPKRVLPGYSCYPDFKGGRFAANFHKSQMSDNLLDLRTFRKCDTSQILRFADPIFFVICGHKTSARPQMHTFSLSKLSKFEHNKKFFTQFFSEKNCNILEKLADLRFAD